MLYHMFTLIELEDDPAAKDDIREEIKEEAEKVGPVVSVKLFDSDPVSLRLLSVLDSVDLLTTVTCHVADLLKPSAAL